MDPKTLPTHTQDGQWGGRQVIPKDWIELITAPQSDLEESHVPNHLYSHFGFQWWFQEETGTVWANGYGEHFLMVDPTHDLVLVERNFSGNSLLSTARWLSSGNKFSGSLWELIDTHAMLVKISDS
ncbi:hypothetical protein GP644_23110 [Parasedimentitalea maritima]|uniref:Uncharacterized protein n=1 Tax=Parasedimentitalea maritima TaxID=2578117 RepID=A0A6A4RA01_9RHOB|nr:hypothetical protein GP644_23110 [Zongyanglinia marina]